MERSDDAEFSSVPDLGELGALRASGGVLGSASLLQSRFLFWNGFSPMGPPTLRATAVSRWQGHGGRLCPLGFGLAGKRIPMKRNTFTNKLATKCNGD